MSHDVFNVIPKNPEVQHVPYQVHPAAVEEHTGDQRGVGGNDYTHLRRFGFPEHEGRDRPVLKHERFSRAGRKAGLIEKDEDADGDTAIVTTGVSWVGLSSCSGIMVFFTGKGNGGGR